MSTTIMTNMGPRVKKLEPLPLDKAGGDASGSVDGLLRVHSPSWGDGRPSSAQLLPPLDKPARVIEALDGVVGEVDGGSSPARRARKAGMLLGGPEGGGKSVLQASMMLDHRDREMALVRETRRDYGRLLLELWVNQVLDPKGAEVAGAVGGGMGPGGPPGGTQADPLKIDSASLRGLVSYGLTRPELLGAGLSNDSVDRLYRGMYVYTVGFFDVMQDILCHCAFRTEVLSNVWRGFLTIAEAALSVAFKSDYLKLYQSQQVAMAELLFTKEALVEARQDGAATEKAIAWLTAAHAEERAQRVVLSQRLEDVTSTLEREQAAHQAAVAKYVAEVEARTVLGMELDARNKQLDNAVEAHVELLAQRDGALTSNADLAARVASANLEMNRLYTALTMDEALADVPEPSLKEALQAVAAAAAAPEEEGGDGGASSEAAFGLRAQACRQLGEALYDMWRDKFREAKETATALYHTRDSLREARTDAFDTRAELARSRQEAQSLANELAELRAQHANTCADLQATQAVLARTKDSLAKSEADVDRLDKTVLGLNHDLDSTTGDRDALIAQVNALSSILAQRKAELRDETALREHWEALAAEMSKGFALSWGAQQANQTARLWVRSRLGDEKRKTSELSFKLYQVERQSRVLEGKLDQLKLDVVELTRGRDEALIQRKAADGEAQQLRYAVAEKEEFIMQLQRQIADLQGQVYRLTDDLARQQRLCESTEDKLRSSRNEIEALGVKLFELEEGINKAAGERVKLVAQINRLVAEKRGLEEKFKQREDLLQMEIQRGKAEAKAEKNRAEGVGSMLETARKQCDDLQELLARKRQKKQKWKRQAGEWERDCRNVADQLAAKEGVLAALDARIGPMEVELAILLADRGRGPPPDLAALAAAAGGGKDSARSTGRDSARKGQAQKSPRTQQVQLPPLVLQPGSEGGGQDQPPLPEFGDMTESYQKYLVVLQDAKELQAKVAEHNRVLSSTRRDYERARALFQATPTDDDLKHTMIVKEAEMADSRVERAELESKLQTVTVSLRDMQAHFRAYDAAQAANRVKAVEARAGKQSSALQSEMGVRLEEAEARARALQNELADQLQQYEDALAARTEAEQAMQRMEMELVDLGNKFQKLSIDKAETDAHLRQAKAQVAYLQSDVAGVMRERDSVKAQLAETESKLAAASAELATAGSTLQAALRRVEANFAAEKEALITHYTAAVGALQRESEAKSGQIAELRTALTNAHDTLRGFLAHCYRLLEHQQEPSFLFYFQTDGPQTPLLELSLLPDIALVPETNLNVSDPVVHWLANHMSFDMALIIASHVMCSKLLTDIHAEEKLLGAQPGPRVPIERAMYDLFVSRYSTRRVAEVHLAAFLTTIRRCRNQHPKARVFARLLGMQAPGEPPLPPQALEFYMSALNRVHARAGPLINETVEGFSLVKAKVLGRVAREMVRGAFATMTEEAAGTTDHIRFMSLNDEEKSIDMELALEMILNAYVSQYNADFTALRQIFAKTYEPTGTARVHMSLEELQAFLHQLAPEKAMGLDEGAAVTMLRYGLRKAGPKCTERGELGDAICRSILDSGFVGFSAHLTRLEPIKSPPPYDEYRMLEESWKAMRAVAEAQILVIQSCGNAVGADLISYMDAARRLDQALDVRDNPAGTWMMYRKVLSHYAQYRDKTDALTPFKSPPSSARSGAGSLFGSSRGASRLDTRSPPGGDIMLVSDTGGPLKDGAGLRRRGRAVGGLLTIAAGDDSDEGENGLGGLGGAPLTARSRGPVQRTRSALSQSFANVPNSPNVPHSYDFGKTVPRKAGGVLRSKQRKEAKGGEDGEDGAGGAAAAGSEDGAADGSDDEQQQQQQQQEMDDGGDGGPGEEARASGSGAGRTGQDEEAEENTAAGSRGEAEDGEG